MADWTEQITELQRSWVTQQQQLMQEWLGSLKNMGDSSLRANWRKAADVMEQQVRSALDAQTRSLLACVDNLEKVDGMPDEATQVLTQTRANIERWAAVQGDIWKVWFDTLRETAPAPQTPGEALMEQWEDLVKKTISIQDNWLSR